MAETKESYCVNPNQKTYCMPHRVDHLVEVKDIYFAEKVKKYKWTLKEETYNAKSGENPTLIKTKQQQKLIAEKKIIRNLKTDFNKPKVLKPNEEIKLTWEEQEDDGFEFIKINKIRIGKKIFIVANCNGESGKLTIEIKEFVSQNSALMYNNTIAFLLDEQEKTKIEFNISKDKNEYEQEIKLRPKNDEDLKKIEDKFYASATQQTFLFLKGEVSETKDEIKFPDETHEFCNKDKIRLQVSVKQTCPINANHRSHFVLHCTAGNMSEASIKQHTDFGKATKKRSKAHKYVMPDGNIIEIWNFTERNVWATKSESQNNLKGQMFHVEINYGPPTVPTDAQYNSVANLYIEASEVEDCWPIIVPHIEIDRGINDGHGDPTDFDYNKFYKILKDKNVPIENIPHFDHDRYWGDKSYKVPWANDKKSWPPILKGNPHK